MSRSKHNTMKARLLSQNSKRKAIISNRYFKAHPIHAIIKSQDCLWLTEQLITRRQFRERINERDEDDDNNTPLHVASIHHFAIAIPYLISFGADQNSINVNGDTPLHLSISTDRSLHTEDTLSALVIHNANINAQNRLGQTPLMRAIQENNSSVALFLLQLNPNVNIQDNEGNTALHYWARQPNGGRFNSFGVFHAMMRHQASLKITNRQKQSVLHILTKEGDYSNLNLVCDYPFDILAKDIFNKSPHDYYQDRLKKHQQNSFPQKMNFSYNLFKENQRQDKQKSVWTDRTRFNKSKPKEETALRMSLRNGH